MPHPSYWFEKIHEAISNPKGDRAHLVTFQGCYIDDLLDHYKGSLSKDNLLELEVEHLTEKLREYIQKNYTSGKFQTRKYARKLASDLKTILSNDSTIDN